MLEKYDVQKNWKEFVPFSWLPAGTFLAVGKEVQHNSTRFYTKQFIIFWKVIMALFSS